MQRRGQGAVTAPPGRMVCSGCGAAVDESEPLAFRCPQTTPGDDVDHVLRAELQLVAGAFVDGGEDNPFVRFRQLSYTWRMARRLGMTDNDYVALVEALDAAVAEVDGHGFRETPTEYCEALNVVIKNETAGVAGSHKARHLLGIALHLQVVARLGLVGDEVLSRTLAIASCGNAALAAAVIAKATRRALRVFVPPSARPSVMARLEELGAERIVCERRTEDPPGDPCYLRFREAVVAGALPFCCQGPDNALHIVGGMTLGFELMSHSLDRLFVQVGGGGLASSVVQAYQVGQALGLVEKLPRFHMVQTRGAAPLSRALGRVMQRNKSHADGLEHARTHRSQYMWPWEKEPASVAGGILDDETYDWYAIAGALLATDGSVITAAEETLVQAEKLGQSQAGISVSATGAAGLAGVLELRGQKALGDSERVGVLFTGGVS